MCSNHPIFGAQSAISNVPAVAGQNLGWRLTTLFGNNAVTPITAPKKKTTLLPLLTVVFLISYGLMTLLIIEQNTAIQAQRSLIHVLLGDSRELLAMKGKVLTNRSIPAPTPAQKSLTQIPLHAQTPSTHVPSTKTPSTQVPQHHSQSRTGKSAKPDTQVPPMPASDLGDQRRVVITL